jgi:hypothetical protein
MVDALGCPRILKMSQSDYGLLAIQLFGSDFQSNPFFAVVDDV